ncbi:hypothetical protein [Sphingomonas sp.]|uniref:hypothetical protein n=1 Tax=Sphingomonas sp. TaxID=28214 RepID=UPI0035BC2477
MALAGCGQQPTVDAQAGERLEAAARGAGLITDPKGSLVGAWMRDTDRVCIIPGAGGATRIGALVNYSDGQACAAAGTLERSGERVGVIFGDCRFDARFDGERLTFPAELPVACERMCQGRASLAALVVERQGASASEAATLRAPDGTLLCGA